MSARIISALPGVRGLSWRCVSGSSSSLACKLSIPRSFQVSQAKFCSCLTLSFICLNSLIASLIDLAISLLRHTNASRYILSDLSSTRIRLLSASNCLELRCRRSCIRSKCSSCFLALLMLVSCALACELMLLVKQLMDCSCCSRVGAQMLSRKSYV